MDDYYVAIKDIGPSKAIIVERPFLPTTWQALKKLEFWGVEIGWGKTTGFLLSMDINYSLSRQHAAIDKCLH